MKKLIGPLLNGMRKDFNNKTEGFRLKVLNYFHS